MYFRYEIDPYPPTIGELENVSHAQLAALYGEELGEIKTKQPLDLLKCAVQLLGPENVALNILKSLLAGPVSFFVEARVVLKRLCDVLGDIASNAACAILASRHLHPLSIDIASTTTTEDREPHTPQKLYISLTAPRHVQMEIAFLVPLKDCNVGKVADLTNKQPPHTIPRR